MADGDALQELGALHSGFSELARVIPTRSLLDFQEALNQISVQSTGNAAGIRLVNSSLVDLTRTTTISRNEFARYVADYSTGVNRLNMGLSSFTTLAQAVNKVDPFNTENRVRGLLQYSNQYGSIIQKLFSSYDQEKNKLTDVNTAYRVRELAIAKGDYALQGLIETLTRGGVAQDNFATKSLKMAQAMGNARLTMAQAFTNLPGIGGLLDYFGTPSGANSLLITGALGAGRFSADFYKKLGSGVAGGGAGGVANPQTGGAQTWGAGVLPVWANRNIGKTSWSPGPGNMAMFGLAGIASAAQLGEAHSPGEAGGSLGSTVGSAGYMLGPLVGTATTLVGSLLGKLFAEKTPWGQKAFENFGPTKEEKDAVANELERTAKRIQVSGDTLAQSFAYVARSAQQNINLVREEYTNPGLIKGATRANIQANIGYQGALVGTGQVSVQALLGSQKALYQSIGAQIADTQALKGAIETGNPVAVTQAFLKSHGITKAYNSSSSIKDYGLSSDELSELTSLHSGMRNPETSKAMTLTIDTEVKNLQSQQIQAMNLVRRTYMEQMTGMAMGLANGTYTMPSMMSDRQKYGGHYGESSGMAGYMPLTRAAIAGRAVNERFGDRWGTQYASQLGNPIAGDIAGRTGLGGRGTAYVGRNSSGGVVNPGVRTPWHSMPWSFVSGAYRDPNRFNVPQHSEGMPFGAGTGRWGGSGVYGGEALHTWSAGQTVSSKQIADSSVKWAEDIAKMSRGESIDGGKHAARFGGWGGSQAQGPSKEATQKAILEESKKQTELLGRIPGAVTSAVSSLGNS